MTKRVNPFLNTKTKIVPFMHEKLIFLLGPVGQESRNGFPFFYILYIIFYVSPTRSTTKPTQTKKKPTKKQKKKKNKKKTKKKKKFYFSTTRSTPSPLPALHPPPYPLSTLPLPRFVRPCYYAIKWINAISNLINQKLKMIWSIKCCCTAFQRHAYCLLAMRRWWGPNVKKKCLCGLTYSGSLLFKVDLRVNARCVPTGSLLFKVDLRGNARCVPTGSLLFKEDLRGNARCVPTGSLLFKVDLRGNARCVPTWLLVSY